MAQRETFTKEQFWSELDALGEEEVRINLYVRKIYGDGNGKRGLAEEWIRRKDESRRSAIEQENLQIARDAGKQARISNMIAIAALVVSVIAVVIALLNPGS